MKLYGYYRSSAAYRVRIALNLKGLNAEHVGVHLRHGDQHAPGFRRLNPAALVPVLQQDGQWFSQSLAIIEYLEEIQPHPALLPARPADRAYVRALALSIACDIHPLNNLRVLNYLKDDLKVGAPDRVRWYAHWIATGLTALEAGLSSDARVATYCCGDQPGLADVCLVPQVYNAERMQCDLSAYPTLLKITAAARAHPAFAAASPERQADAE
jgi:maleylacetoacetate isomerase